MKKPPERTYRSGINHFSLVAKWPGMEHRHQANNSESYRRRDDVNGPKEWISITVQSNFENLSPAQIKQQIEYKRSHLESGITGILIGQLKGEYLHLPNNHFEKMGIDSNLGLSWAKVIGPDSERPAIGNDVAYWDGDVTNKVTTYVSCTGPLPSKRISMKRCEHRYELPELHAEVVVYYYLPYLPQWRKIQDQTRAFILSLQRKPASVEDSPHEASGAQ